MNNLLSLLGIRVAELKDLILVPEQTLYSWFARQSTIPPEYSGYISGLEIYQQQQNSEDLNTIYSKWEASNRALLETQKTKALARVKGFGTKKQFGTRPTQTKRNSITPTVASLGTVSKTSSCSFAKY